MISFYILDAIGCHWSHGRYANDCYNLQDFDQDHQPDMLATDFEDIVFRKGMESRPGQQENC